MKRFVVGDIHGQYTALLQCLERASFNYDTDTLISVGDLVDRGKDSFLVIEELLKIKNLITVRGNHDLVFQNWYETGKHMLLWLHGGEETRLSYILKGRNINDVDNLPNFITKLDVPDSHYNLLKNQLPYYIDSENNCFIHGGFDKKFELINQDENDFYWDRTLWNKALCCRGEEKLKTKNGFNQIFIGHTPTFHWTEVGVDELGNKKLMKITNPMYSGGVWNLDTGAGFSEGKLTIMDIDTKQYWQSNLIGEL
jgi:serine/threonine protein phosphatase 1